MQHSEHSFSGSYIWINCFAAVRMQRGEPNTSNPQSELGTAAHELGEFCYAYGLTTYECIGMTFNKVLVDEDMANGVAVYVGHIKSLELETGVKPMIEQKVTLYSLGRDDVYGTSDMILVYVLNRKLYVSDYKNGRGLVEIKDNTQFICYALATLDTFWLWNDIDEIVTTVIQPNGFHIDGIIRSHSYNMNEMQHWLSVVKHAVKMSEDISQKPNAGDWCTWCRGRAKCRERMTITMEHAYVDSPLDEMSLDELLVFFREFKAVENHMKAVTDRLTNAAITNGETFEDYKLVKKIARSKVEDEKGLIAAAGDNASKMFEPKLISMTKAKKILPPETIAKFYVKGDNGSELVKLNDSRPAINKPAAFDAVHEVTK